MKILFVNAINSRSPVQTKFKPLSFGYLTAYSRKMGIDFHAEAVSYLDRKILGDKQPDVVAFSCVTETYPFVQAYAVLVKRFNPKIKVMLGGVHISALPHTLPRYVDVGILGEGEQTFFELAQNHFNPHKDIDGVTYWNHDKLVQTKPRQLIEPLDLIPHPDRNLFGVDHEPYIFTSRGCSYRCQFCYSSRFWQKVRLHSAEYVAAELNDLKQSRAKHINVYDDTFLLSPQRVQKIYELTKHLGLTYTVAARANQITQDTAKLLSDFGVNSIGIGFESNSQRILDLMQKGNRTEDNQRAVDLLRQVGIRVSGSFITGYPSETEQDRQATQQFIQRNRIHATVHKLINYPGTPLYDGGNEWGNYQDIYVEPFTAQVRHRLAKIKPLRALYYQVVGQKIKDKTFKG